jgi:trehalose-6-phosphate synthase
MLAQSCEAPGTMHAALTGVTSKQNLIIVSNRLPVNVSRDPVTGRWSLPMSPGGLVSALLSVSQV